MTIIWLKNFLNKSKSGWRIVSLSFLSEMQVALPEYLTGTARFQNINKMITFNTSWKKEAYENLRNLLKHMRKIEASDIDFGGPGSNGKVWYRVYGVKTSSDDVPQYTEDEITAIILSVLIEDQKVILFNNKNIDFSLGIVLEFKLYLGHAVLLQ